MLCLRPYGRHIGLFIASSVARASAAAGMAIVLKLVIDDGVIAARRDLVVQGAIAIAALASLEALFQLVGHWASARAGEGLVYDLRVQVYDHLQRQPIAFFNRTPTGALVSRVSGDLIGAQKIFTSVISQVLGNLITLVFTAAAMFMLSWQLTLPLLVLLPLFFVPARTVGKRLAKLARAAMQLNAALGHNVTERFSAAGALLVKTFGRYTEEASTLRRAAGRLRDLRVRQSVYSQSFVTGLMIVGSLATAFVYGLGGWLAVDGVLQVGTLVAVVALLARLYGPMTVLSNVQVEVMTAVVSFERVFEILDFVPLVSDRVDAAPLPANAASIEFQNVSFRYPDSAAVSLPSLASLAPTDTGSETEPLTGISFRVGPGEMVALVGPSGAGKSTIMRLIARLYDPTEGVVRIGGHDVRTVTLQSLHEAVGMVTQDAHFFHDTVRANLTYASPDATEEQLEEALRMAQAWDMVSSLSDGLETVVGDSGYRMSGGEKQRLAIARVLLKSPRIVLMDEPTAHLDSECESAIQEALNAALARHTSLIIAHRLSTIWHADRILMINDGRVVEEGSHDELLAADGQYATFYRTQFRSRGSRREVHSEFRFDRVEQEHESRQV